MDLPNLYKWGKIKGINIIGTGDFTHPGWFEQIQQQLEPAEPGLFKLKDELAKVQDQQLAESLKPQLIRFILTTEISTIYSKDNQTRKLHQLIVAPDFFTVSAINSQLSQIGNLKSDGRPILGLNSAKLLEIILAINPNCLFIPAHIWTPWFSLFGSKSGFNSIEEAFGDLSHQIYAVETGLSSDPFMNWRFSDLDRLTLVSHSDAHSPSKLGREANIINCQLSYQDIFDAIKTNDQRMVGTIEFFPQEGKYHYDGHRSCAVCLSPQDSFRHRNLCPKCGKKLTLGVDHRVGELANRPADFRPFSHKKVEYIVPLGEIIAEIKQVKSASNQKVTAEYHRLIATLGPEFSILRQISLDTVSQAGFFQLAQALGKMRSGQVSLQPGYDGVYGVVKLLNSLPSTPSSIGQISLL